jgi:hypothetical protein
MSSWVKISKMTTAATMSILSRIQRKAMVKPRDLISATAAPQR